MALHIEDPELVRRIEEMSAARRVSPEEVVRSAVDAESARARAKYEEILMYLEEQVWSHLPPELLGKTITKAEEEAMLGYGPGQY